FTAPITSRSHSFPTSSTGKPATATVISVLIGRGAFPIYHKPRTRTVRAGFISAFIGASTRPNRSPWVTGWAITYSTTPSRRFARDKEEAVPSALCFSLQKRHQAGEID